MTILIIINGIRTLTAIINLQANCKLFNPYLWFIEQIIDNICPLIIALYFFYKTKVKQTNYILKAPKTEFDIAVAAIRLSAC